VKFTTFLLAAVTQIAAAAQQPTAITSEIVVVPSGALRLKALLWLPDNDGPFPAVLFNHGSGSSDAMHTGPFVITEAAERLGPMFVKHGYAFLYLFDAVKDSLQIRVISCKNICSARKWRTEKKLERVCSFVCSPPTTWMT
jgi:hypothetical protein